MPVQVLTIEEKRSCFPHFDRSHLPVTLLQSSQTKAYIIRHMKDSQWFSPVNTYASIFAYGSLRLPGSESPISYADCFFLDSMLYSIRLAESE